MKTSEFIRKVESLGYIADVNDYEIFVEMPCVVALIASVLRNTTNVIDTEWTAFIELPESERAELFSVLAEYASTPIEQREEEKVYQLRHIFIKTGYGSDYLNFVVGEHRCTIKSEDESDIYKTKATVSQWEEWTGRTWEQLLQEFDEIEVG